MPKPHFAFTLSVTFLCSYSIACNSKQGLQNDANTCYNVVSISEYYWVFKYIR